MKKDRTTNGEIASGLILVILLLAFGYVFRDNIVPRAPVVIHNHTITCPSKRC